MEVTPIKTACPRKRSASSGFLARSRSETGRDRLAREEHAESPVAVEVPGGGNHFVSDLKIVRRFENPFAASQPEGLERERPVTLLIGTFFQRDLPRHAVAR